MADLSVKEQMADKVVDKLDEALKVQVTKYNDPVRFNPVLNEWGYWDETWSNWTGGFETQSDARDSLQKYCLEVLGW